jgi:hypothetical protein
MIIATLNLLNCVVPVKVIFFELYTASPVITPWSKHFLMCIVQNLFCVSFDFGCIIVMLNLLPVDAIMSFGRGEK